MEWKWEKQTCNTCKRKVVTLYKTEKGNICTWCFNKFQKLGKENK